MLKKYFLKPWVLLLLGLTGVSATIYTNDKLFEIAKNLELFANVFREVNTNYVDEVDPGSLMKIGIDAMLNSLDPYTNYISESQVQSYRISDDDRYQGIGTDFVSRADKVFISSPLSGGPSHEAGLRDGDELLRVNGVPVTGKKVDEIHAIVRGVAGTEVNLEIKKFGSGDVQNLRIKRDEVNIPNVPFSGFVADGIGYINLTTFTDKAGANISKALKSMKRENQNMQGLVLDLRENGGGLLREAIAICSIFLPKGEEIVTTKGKNKDKDFSYKTFGTPEELEMPIVVLVNDHSASASEIVSGVLQDMDRAVILGQRSYGKGLVQNFFEVGYNSRVKVTISKYYVPSGRCIQGVEYSNGEPINIPDSKRSKFKTRNGRTVLDGGGITPDVRMPKPEVSPITKALLSQGIIFDFVNQFASKLDTVDVETYAFNSYDQFLKHLKGTSFQYRIQGEDQIDSLAHIAENSGAMTHIVSAEVKSMRQKISQFKADELQTHKQEIVHEIEKELAARFGFQQARTRMGLKRDDEITEAVKLLRDPVKYNTLLKP